MVSRLPAARRRRQLLDVALDVFARNGFHQTSMEDVADAAGVTKPVLYQHFGSKRELYRELLEDVGGQMMVAVAKAVATARGPQDQVQVGFAAYFRFVSEHQNAFKLLFGGGARRDEEFADAVRVVENSIADEIATLIDADLDAEHRRLLAHGLVGLAEGASRYWVNRAGGPNGSGANGAENNGAGSSGAENKRAESSGAESNGAESNRAEIDTERLSQRMAQLAWAGLRGVARD